MFQLLIEVYHESPWKESRHVLISVYNPLTLNLYVISCPLINCIYNFFAIEICYQIMDLLFDLYFKVFALSLSFTT